MERRVTKSHIETTSSNVDGNSYHTVSLNMTVTNATIDDQGDYRCNVTDGNGRIFSMVKRINILDKHLPPTINFTTDFNTSIPLLHDKDEDVRFMVVVNAFPDISLFNLTWYKDDERLDLNTPHYQIETFSDVSTQISFYIPKSRSFDSGIYTLVGNYSTASANISFTVLISGEPELILENVLDFYVVNQSYELICKSFAFPKGLVWWSWFPCNSPSSCFNELMEQKQNLLHHKIQDDWINISSIMDESVLNVSNQAVMLNDLNQGKPYLNMSKLQIGTALHLGIYRCSSLNIYKGVQHRQTPFLVMDSDELFSVTSSTDEPTINDTIVLTCKASLIQFEDIDWIITSPEHLKLIRPKTTNLYSVTSTVLLTSVQLNDSGTFTCMAKRRGSSQYDQKDVVLIVKNVSSPMIMDTNMENKLIEKDFSSQFELRCYVSGRPTPNVVWYRNGRQFFTKHDLGIRSEERGQRLVFTRLLDRDSGHYECRANNRGGSVVRKAFLRVKGNDSYETIQLGEILFTIFLVLIGMMMLFMALSVGKKIRDEKLNKRELEFFSQKIFEHGQMEMFNPEMPLDEQIDLLPYDSRFEFPKERLELGHTLGQGAFGRVVKAKAIGLENDESTTTVAVKMLKERADANQRKALMAELKILIHLGRHLNIVNLLGAVTKNIAKGELLVIVEFCEFGNLRHFLYTNRDSFINELEQPPPLYGDYQNFEFIQSQLNHRRSTEPSTPSTPNTPNENNINTNGGQGSPLAYFNHNYVSGNSSFTSSFTFKRPRSNATRVSTSDLKCFAFQCARGMEYLTSRKLIHRDLAARNVLLATNNVVKICDFGLAKDVYKYDNYVKKDDGPLPIKWMAIESISDKIFTSKSDVWSFGILLWEIFTLGKNPYPGVEIDERFFKRLKAGYRMEKPEYSSDEIYGLMCQCWAANPNERPDFGEIVSIIGDLMDDKIRQHYIDLNNPYLERNHQIFNQTDEYLKMNSMCSGYAEGYLRMDSERADDEDGSDIMLEEQNNNSANKLVRQAQNEPNVILVDGKTKIEMINMQNLSFQQDTSRHIPSETATTFRTSSLEVLSYDNLNQMIPNGTLNGQIHHHHHHNHHHHPIGHLQQTIPK
ncbi:hypothetical protein RDWZM_003521 [Blomia tropicalis]|uniref:receptor protein-tyrosine kinase n=1 Tax=Blomia tropicalis TaxID=40697 RepID=A0A9Q0RSM7_BLOTA|nr:hypothetical protein RDWZM_003521 [Blomia tropicalis]